MNLNPGAKQVYSQNITLITSLKRNIYSFIYVHSASLHNPSEVSQDNSACRNVNVMSTTMNKNPKSSSTVPHPGTVSTEDVCGEVSVEPRYTQAQSRVCGKGPMPSQDEEKMQTPTNDVEGQREVVFRHHNVLNALKNCGYFTAGLIISAVIFVIFMVIAVAIAILLNLRLSNPAFRH